MKETHDFIYENTKELWPELGENRRAVLQKALKNFRGDKGMSLSYDAFNHLNDNKIYDFMKFNKPKFLQSRELMWFDKKSTSPYYIQGKYIYLSDEVHSFTFELIQNIDDFVAFLKN